jgi:hypothetical protein
MFHLLQSIFGCNALLWVTVFQNNSLIKLNIPILRTVPMAMKTSYLKQYSTVWERGLKCEYVHRRIYYLFCFKFSKNRD